MRSIVTGGAGFIGSNLVDALLERGDQVTVIDNLSTGKRENLDAARRRRGRRSRSSTSATPTRSTRCSSRPGPRSSSTWPRRSTSASPSATRRSTRRSTCWGRSRCSRPRARRACGASSTPPPAAGCTATPSCCRRPRPTRSRRWPRTARASSSAEGYCGLYTRLHGLSSVSLRYGNVYGPRQDVHGEAGVVAIFCGHLIDGKTPTIFGDGAPDPGLGRGLRRRPRQPARRRRPRSPVRSTSATARRPRCSISCRRSTRSRASVRR